jgi:hypothetical protein
MRLFRIFGVIRSTVGLIAGRARAATAGARGGDPALVGILVLAALVRLVGISFGLPHPQVRPDEGTIGSIATGFYQGGLNPHFFNYPALFMVAVAACLALWLRLGSMLGFLRGRDAMNAMLTPTNIHGIARLLSATAGVATVWLVFRVAERLFDRTTAMVSAAFLALAFLHVRDSHFGVTDVAATFMAFAAFLFIVRLAESGATRDLIAAGIMSGLATSTKYNVAIIALPAILVIVSRGRDPFVRRLGRVGVFGAVMTVAFLAASPYSLLEWRQFIEALRAESVHLASGHGVNVGRGWYVHMRSTLRHGLGLPMLLGSLGGMLWLVWKRPRQGTLIALFPVAYYLVLGSGYTVFARYMMPVVPFLCLTAGYATTAVGRWLADRAGRPAWAPFTVAIGALLVLAPPTASVFHLDRLLSRADSRVIAARFVENRFPRGARIAHVGPEGGHIFAGAAGCPQCPQYPNVELAANTPTPDVIVVQSSPLLPAEDLGPIREVLAKEFELGLELLVSKSDPRNVYDWQDEFYLPLSGFHGIQRPGPNLQVYIRRSPS